MNFDYFIGIDPGKSGGLVRLSTDRTVLSTRVMGSLAEVLNWLELEPHPQTMVILERAQVMPKNGSVSMFNYGQGYGELIGVLTTLRMPFVCVGPSTWTKTMHGGLSRSLTPKERSRKAYEQLFPSLDLRATERCKKPHEGLIDALLIAEYGRLTYGSSSLNS